MTENSSVEPISRSVTQKIYRSTGFLNVIRTETAQFSHGIVRRSVSVTQWFYDRTLAYQRMNQTVDHVPSTNVARPELLQIMDNNNNSSWWASWRKIIAFVCIAVFLNLILFPPFYLNRVWPARNLKKSLESKIYGQTNAIELLVYAVDRLFQTNNSGIISLTGTSGVGKTLASSILQKEYPWRGNVYFEFADRLTNKRLVKPLYKNLFFIEDCRKRNMENTISFIDSLFTTAKKTGNQIVIFPIFTYKDESEMSEFLSKLSWITFMYHYDVPFQNLDRDAVKMCFKAKIQSTDSIVSEDHLKKLVDMHMKVNSVENLSIGCKQIDALLVKYLSFVPRPYDKDDSFFD